MINCQNDECDNGEVECECGRECCKGTVECPNCGGSGEVCSNCKFDCGGDCTPQDR